MTSSGRTRSQAQRHPLVSLMRLMLSVSFSATESMITALAACAMNEAESTAPVAWVMADSWDLTASLSRSACLHATGKGLESTEAAE